VLAKPTEGTFNRLTIKVNGGPNQDTMDSFSVPLTFDSFTIDNLTDQDLADIIQVLINRVVADHPDYTVFVTHSWTGAYSALPDTVYTPTPEPEPAPETAPAE
jgi:hypothetical protein